MNYCIISRSASMSILCLIINHFISVVWLIMMAKFVWWTMREEPFPFQMISYSPSQPAVQWFALDWLMLLTLMLTGRCEGISWQKNLLLKIRISCLVKPEISRMVFVNWGFWLVSSSTAQFTWIAQVSVLTTNDWGIPSIELNHNNFSTSKGKAHWVCFPHYQLTKMARACITI